MSKSFRAFGLAVGAVVLTQLPAAAQTKVTNEGISASEIVIGTHQDLSGLIKGWGVPVSNGMKMAVRAIATTCRKTIRDVVELSEIVTLALRQKIANAADRVDLNPGSLLREQFSKP